MTNLMNTTLIIVLILLVVLIVLYYFGFLTYTAADLPPFSDLKYAIEPSVLKEAKRDYNKIISIVFSVLNNQTNDLNNEALDGPLDGPMPQVIQSIQEELSPMLTIIASKYTPEVRGKLIKYFVIKHLKIILDNYYLGPPMYFPIPDIPYLSIKAFPFVYHAKRRAGAKPARASTLAPLKYFKKDIPKNIRSEVLSLYDDIIKRYMRAFNRSVQGLTDLNYTTIKTIDFSKTLKKYGPMIARDFQSIKKLYGANVSRVIQAIFSHNLLPLLNNFYKGPPINLYIPTSIPSNPQLISINFPNTNANNIIKVEPGCDKNLVLQTTIIDKQKNLVFNECVKPSGRDLSKVSIHPIDCPPGYLLQTTLVDPSKNSKMYECVPITKNITSSMINPLVLPSMPSMPPMPSMPTMPSMPSMYSRPVSPPRVSGMAVAGAAGMAAGMATRPVSPPRIPGIPAMSSRPVSPPRIPGMPAMSSRPVSPPPMPTRSITPPKMSPKPDYPRVASSPRIPLQKEPQKMIYKTNVSSPARQLSTSMPSSSSITSSSSDYKRK